MASSDRADAAYLEALSDRHEEQGDPEAARTIRAAARELRRHRSARPYDTSAESFPPARVEPWDGPEDVIVTVGGRPVGPSVYPARAHIIADWWAAAGPDLMDAFVEHLVARGVLRDPRRPEMRGDASAYPTQQGPESPALALARRIAEEFPRETDVRIELDRDPFRGTRVARARIGLRGTQPPREILLEHVADIGYLVRIAGRPGAETARFPYAGAARDHIALLVRSAFATPPLRPSP